jgi:hypothetical protein
LSCDFNAKVGREDIFKPTTGHTNLHKISNDNGVRAANFAPSKNLIVKSTMFPHHNIHEYIWTFPDGKPHGQLDRILIDWQRHSSILNVRSFGSADCHNDNYLVVANIREGPAVNKQGSQTFHMERFNLRKFNKVEGKEKYDVEVKRFVALEDFDAEVEINTPWKPVGGNIKISAKESLFYRELKKPSF